MMGTFSHEFWRIYARCAVSVCATAAIACVLIFWLVDKDVRERGAREQALLTQANMLKEMAGPLLKGRSDPSLTTRVHMLAARSDMRFTVIGPDGTPLLDTERDPSAMGALRSRAEILAARAVGLGRSRQYIEARNEWAFYLALPVYDQDKTLIGYVRSFGYVPYAHADPGEDRRFRWATLAILAGMTLALALWPLLGTYFTFRRIA